MILTRALAAAVALGANGGAAGEHPDVAAAGIQLELELLRRGANFNVDIIASESILKSPRKGTGRAPIQGHGWCPTSRNVPLNNALGCGGVGSGRQQGASKNRRMLHRMGWRDGR